MNIFKNVKKYLKILGKAFFYLIMDIVWLISYIIPKDKNLWIFGSWFGNKFADNSKYLYLYIKKYHPEIRAIWLSKNINVINKLRKEGYEAYKTYSFSGFLYSMKASCVIVSTGLNDVNQFAIARSKKVQLWHGTPLKKIGYDNTYFSSLLGKTSKFKIAILKLFFFLSDSYDLIVATSSESKKKMISAFRVDESKVIVTGYPRNDAIYSTGWLNSLGFDYIERLKGRIDFKYVFAYMPTCRGIGYVGIDLFSKYNFDIQLMQNILENLSGVLIIKLHHYNSFKNGINNFSSSNRIFIVSDQELQDIYPFLKQVDVLITDYSSVYFDFLLLNKPIIFAPFDINEYKATTDELYYNYEEVTPGPKARDWDEVINYMYEAIKRPKEYEDKRLKVNKMFNFYNDDRNSERVFNEMLKLIKPKCINKGTQ